MPTARNPLILQTVRALTIIWSISVAAWLAAGAATAAELTVHCAFCKQMGAWRTDGSQPRGGLVVDPSSDGRSPRGVLLPDAANDLFGLTAGGGKTNNGSAFELKP